MTIPTHEQQPLPAKVESARVKAMNRMDSLATNRCDAAIKDAQSYVTQAFIYFVAALAEAQCQVSALTAELAKTKEQTG